MPRALPALALALVITALAVGRPDDTKDATKDAAPKDKNKDAAQVTQGFVKFRPQEIEKELKVGYAVVVTDVNGDGKPDIVVVDTDRVVWYENPSWRRRTIIENLKDPETRAVIEKKTEPDNVSIAPVDIDGDGKIDFVLASGWTNRFDEKKPSSLQWLRRGKTLDEPWEVHPIPCDEPTVHRVRVADLAGDGKPQIVVAPLMGKDASRGGNFMDGKPVKILAYKIPADPVKGPWTPEVLDQSLHVVHGIAPVPRFRQAGYDLLAASYEGVTGVTRDQAGHWVKFALGEGNQRTPLGVRGSSEVKVGTLREARFLATIEPFHGNQVVVYTPPTDKAKMLWDRKVLDEHLRCGHAVWCADLDGDGSDEIIVGVRESPTKGDLFTEKCGVRIYRCQDTNGIRWQRLLLDEGGVAVEDLTVADLDGDGRPDIIAVGRQTGNLKIYWNVK
jgi:hypothetical protein